MDEDVKKPNQLFPDADPPDENPLPPFTLPEPEPRPEPDSLFIIYFDLEKHQEAIAKVGLLPTRFPGIDLKVFDNRQKPKPDYSIWFYGQKPLYLEVNFFLFGKYPVAGPLPEPTPNPLRDALQILKNLEDKAELENWLQELGIDTH